MKKNKQKKAVHLKSKASHYLYTIMKNTKKPKLTGIKKYDPVTRKHEIFDEVK